MRISRILGGVAVLTVCALSTGQLLAQEVAFETELPRTLVFIEETGRGRVASREMTDFLIEAGFPVIDPALAQDAAQRELVQQAMAGDNGAAVEIGRDFGAQVIFLGVADFASRPDPMTGTLVTTTTEVSIRALRLDSGEIIGSGVSDARVLEATEQAGKAKAIRQATQDILLSSGLMGGVINNWEEAAWQEASYWKPDPGSVPASATAQAGSAPGVAITQAMVRPASGTATRGIGVVKKGGAGLSGVQNEVELRGVVVGEVRSIEVDGAPAIVEPLPADRAAQLGLQGMPAQEFRRTFSLPISQDSVKVVATGSGGATAETVAAPRIDKRWAVIIGVGQYQSDDIPDLEFARADAEAVRDFFQSEAAGPFDEVIFLADEQATGAAMREALFVRLQEADWDDLVVIYYAGHGAPDPGRPDNLYLLPTDSDLGALAATGFPMWDVKTALRRQIAAERVLVIADACHSAGTADGDTVGGGGDNAIAGGFAQLFTPSRRLMMTAADTNEFALEDARWGGNGVFTHFLLEALNGAADDGDGIVTFTEVFDYVANNVRTATDGRQNPQRAGFGDIPLAVVSGGGS